MLRLIFILPVFVAAQVEAQSEGTFMHNRVILERMASTGGGSTPVALGNMSASTPGLVGDVYLNEHYQNSTFMLYEGDKVVKGFQAKLDLSRNEFDIKLTDGLVRTLPGSKVKTLLWTDSITGAPRFLINAAEFHDDEGTPMLGFFEVLSEGEIILLKLTELVFKPADRNLIHNVGGKDNKYIKKPHLYYSKEKTVIKIPNRKGILKLMESRKEDVDKFIKVNEIDLGKEGHLAATFNYYNGLVKK